MEAKDTFLNINGSRLIVIETLPHNWMFSNQIHAVEIKPKVSRGLVHSRFSA